MSTALPAMHIDIANNESVGGSNKYKRVEARLRHLADSKLFDFEGLSPRAAE